MSTAEMFIEYCKTSNIDGIKNMLLIEKNDVLDLDDGFICACREGNYNIVVYLVELYKMGQPNDKSTDVDLYNMNYKPIDIHAEEELGFCTACLHGHYDIVKYLVELYKKTIYTKINIHSRYEGGLVSACSYGHYDIVKYLIELYKYDKNYDKMNIHAENEMCFIGACFYGQCHIVSYLVELYKYDSNYSMIDIHSINEEGFRDACKNGHYDVIVYLVELYKTDTNYGRINIHSKKEAGFRKICKKAVTCRQYYKVVKYLMTLYKKHKYKPFDYYLIIFSKFDKFII